MSWIINYSAFYRLMRIFTEDEFILASKFSPYFYTYFRNYLGDNFRFYCQYVQYIVKLTQAKEQKVIDLGCGFGVMTILFRLFGVKHVVGIDLDNEKVQVANKIIQEVGIDNVCIYQGDVLTSGLPSENFDVAIANEVISHIQDLNRFFEEIHRILKRGGRLYISDGSNALDLRGRFLRRRYWKSMEYGPVNPKMGLEIPYKEMRKEIIKKHFPQVREPELSLLAEITRGLWGKEIHEAVLAFLEGKPFKKSLDFPYRNPLTGEYPEREFNPFTLKRDLERKGFRVKIIPPRLYPAMRIKRFIAWWLMVLHPISIIMSPVFRILAVKQ